MVDSGFPVGRGAGLFGLVVGGTVVGIGFLACMWAVTYGYESFKDDIRTEERAYLLVRAAYHDDVDVVQGLLRMGVDPNRMDAYSNTALDVALYRHATASVDVLRASGAVEGLSEWRWLMEAYSFGGGGQ
ncbi:ankyrin repeat domain-containing protein [bacterium]|nr:ankyrin repeat domain-containing protein [bacterium]MBV6482137.1 hypothetical protein [bacterium]MCK6497731.1 ankyrin repeat domain-containing protein [bacterium]